MASTNARKSRMCQMYRVTRDIVCHRHSCCWNSYCGGQEINLPISP